MFNQINNFVSCIGRPGSGKSTFCSAYYKIKYNVKEDYFEFSSSGKSFTKGIWKLSNLERQKIPNSIDKDIIDAEGFQEDCLLLHKYIMILAFISTDLIIFNRDERSDSVMKMLRNVKTTLNKMNSSDTPRMLKTIVIHLSKKKII